MKPILLEIQAFLAFADPQTIDFRDFEGKDLFLICGPTGAGKTTIFDAICYALYGKTTNGRKDIRSHHVRDKRSTRVRFVFRVGAQYHEVIREETPKPRAEGLTPSQWYRRVSPDLQPMEEALTKTSLINPHIEALLGFNEKQFRQVVILPQGAFQEFLTSNNADREQTLQKLFGQDLFQKIAQQLKERAQSLKAERDAVQTRLHIETSEQTLEDLQEQHRQDQARLQSLQQQLPQAEAAYKQAIQARTTAEAQSEYFAQQAQTQATYQTHLSQAVAIETCQNQAQAAQKAERLRNTFDRLKEQKEKIQALQHQQQTLQQTLQQAQQQYQQATQKRQAAQEQEQQLPQLQEAITKAQAQLPDYQKLKQTQEQAQALQQKVQDLHNQYRICQEDLQKAQQQHQQAQHAYEQARQLAQQQPTLALQLQQYAQQNQDIQALQKLQDQQDKIQYQRTKDQQALNQALQDLDQCRTQLNDTEARWIRSQAARLGETLRQKPDSPCPVCGSTEHPQIAQPNEDFIPDQSYQVAKQDYQNAQQRVQNADLQYQNTELAHQQHQRDISTLQQRIGQIPDDFAQQLQQLKTAHQQATQAQDESKALQQNLQKCEAQLQHHLDESQQLQAQLQAQQQQQAALQARLEDLQERLSAFDSLQKIEQYIHEKQSEQQKIQQQADQARHHHDQAQQAYQDAQTNHRLQDQQLQNLQTEREQGIRDLESQARQLGFTNATAAHQALRSSQEIQQLEQRVQTWQQTKRDLEHTLQDLQQKLQGIDPPILDEYRRQELAAQQSYQDLQREAAATEERRQSQQKKIQRIQDLTQDLQQHNLRLQPYDELAQLANGTYKGIAQQTFQSFALRFLLDQVLIYANQRLQVLSNQRFEIQRQDPHETSGNRKTGLDLQIWDHFTNTGRPTQNLSGGETFITSLALALGLADTVTQQASGRFNRLETLFIDEGFGSLDPETLSRAFDTLCQLEGGHRLVGIISHVSELKEWVKDGIEVEKHNQGSQIKKRHPLAAVGSGPTPKLPRAGNR